MEQLTIAGRRIGSGEPPYIIAEIGANHNGDMQLCRRLIDAARDCGVDAVKFQSWSRSSLISDPEYARHASANGTPSLDEAVRRLQLTPQQHQEVAAYCQKAGVVFFSSCFSPEEVDLLESLDVPAYKIASMDINYLGLLDYVARKKRPVILSTGLSTLGEIELAVATLQRGGVTSLALLHCLSIYPSPAQIVNLRNMKTLESAFDLPVGYSDHCLGNAVALAAVALGACVIEKHFTLDKSLEGWDHAVSADPAEMRALVKDSQDVTTALGSPVRTLNPEQLEKQKAFRRRMVAKRALKHGEELSADAVTFKRPGTGIRPDELSYCAGRKLLHDVAAEEELEWTDFA
jgi:N,N'-diacetyllegionaminate synthase